MWLAAALVIAGRASAQDQSAAVDAAEHNEAFKAGAMIGVTPQSVDEMLDCSALWDRWVYVVESTADPAFAKNLDPELSVTNARKRTAYWLRIARRAQGEISSSNRFEEYKAAAEAEADKYYSAYASGNVKGFDSMMELLGICR
jgi:3-hydroxyisobutyrate dehydrogenase-like beta-hydroxyacid dehydrogenase